MFSNKENFDNNNGEDGDAKEEFEDEDYIDSDDFNDSFEKINFSSTYLFDENEPIPEIDLNNNYTWLILWILQYQ